MDHSTSVTPVPWWENFRRIADDPILAIMVYAVTAIMSDPFMIMTYGGIWMVARTIYAEPSVPPTFNRSTRIWSFTLLGVLFVVFGFPALGRIRLPWDTVFLYETQEFSIPLFPGFVFSLCYFVPILIRRGTDGSFALLNELRLNRRDWIVVGAVCLPLLFRAFNHPSTPLDLIRGLKGYYLPGLLEELLFRGLLLSLFLRVFRTGPAIAMSTLLFALAHHQLVVDMIWAPTVFGAGNVTAIASLGLLLGWIYARTRKLGVCILIHGSVDGLIYLCRAIGICGGDLPAST